jgi:hypothetical protein
MYRLGILALAPDCDDCADLAENFSQRGYERLSRSTPLRTLAGFVRDCRALPILAA